MPLKSAQGFEAIKDINGQGNCRLRRVYEVKLAG